ncbi:FAD-dependent oxidoreductase [Haematobacter missouriensis]|uniref:D-amino-acid oxidase n=1 Tax=Haematobacter missouriensis TaxID=366616 RepID=A0ABX3ZZT1_9RHOB|nr:FAD-dependent oxidoreductase [Haematobacter missouriensis]OWJ79083.1 FAD-dependent oxidoreductase [Haematobacter missouriensis]
MTDVVTILGSGVAGLTVAQELTTRGLRVRIVDPAGAPGPQACSWWAGGMLAPFCEGESADPAVVRLGAQAAEWWHAAGVEVVREGTLVLAPGRDRSELLRFARRTEGHRTLDQEGIAVLEPDLAERFDRALHFAAEAHLAPRTALAKLMCNLVGRGVEFADGGAAEGEVIDCRGLAARDCLPDLRGVRGEMVILRAPGLMIRRPVRLLHPRHPLYIVPRGEGVYMLGATQIETGARGPATLRSVVELLNAAYALHPAFAEAEVVEIGADARPAFPDNMPRVFRRAGRIHVNGLFRHGFLLSPAMAIAAADLLMATRQKEETA